MILLSTAYLPPIEYLAAIATQYSFRPGSSDTEAALVSIEACEHYQKQSWRNRCRILAGDGPQDLNIPVVHDDFGKPISQMRIDWTTDWLTRHKRAIVSAYGTSPYFEYYRDELFEIMDARPSLLLDFNTSILRFLLRKTGIRANISLTQEFLRPGSPVLSSFPDSAFPHSSFPESSVPNSSCGTIDLRDAIHPKRPNAILSDLGLDKPYWQVFSDRFGFVKGLSSIDLLFNEGPDSILWLKECGSSH